MEGRFGWREGAALLGWICLAGCYNYVPTRLAATPPGENVRLRVTRDGARQLAELADVIGVAPEVRGQVVGWDRADLLVRVPVVPRGDGMYSPRLDQTVRVPAEEIISVERREFDGVRTALFVTGGVAAVTGLLVGIMEAFGGPARGTDGSEPDYFFQPFLDSDRVARQAPSTSLGPGWVR